jgi:hypothetical protein
MEQDEDIPIAPIIISKRIINQKYLFKGALPWFVGSMNVVPFLHHFFLFPFKMNIF